MKNIQRVVMIGAGRVATALGLELKQHAIEILQVFSKTRKSARALAEKLNAPFTTSIALLNPDADLYILSVTDDAILPVLVKMKPVETILVHTAGSVPITILSHTARHYGVFYPLNTFSPNRKTDFSRTPVCIEASDPETLEALQFLGNLISTDVRVISSEQRAWLHLAAVFAANFSNFMMIQASDLLSNVPTDHKILLPLLEETLSKLYELSPVESQTGPAWRQDKHLIRKHLEMLDRYPDKKELYEIITRQIIQLKRTLKNP